jgi:hypothetical protein
MSSDPSAAPPSGAKEKRRPKFIFFFLLFVGICSAAGFLTLRYAAQQGVASRREQSRGHLQALGNILAARAATAAGQFPGSVAGLIDAQDAGLAVNPSWPDEDGYIYVTGVRASDPPESLLLYENVPPEKRKIGRLVLRLDGSIELLAEGAFQQRLKAQEIARAAAERPWRTETIAVQAERER